MAGVRASDGEPKRRTIPCPFFDRTEETLTITQDPDIREVAPRIMDILIQRLEGLYMSIAENNPHEPVLRKIPPLSRRARALRGH